MCPLHLGGPEPGHRSWAVLCQAWSRPGPRLGAGQLWALAAAGSLGVYMWYAKMHECVRIDMLAAICCYFKGIALSPPSPSALKGNYFKIQ